MKDKGALSVLKAVVGLGSNLDNRDKNIKSALELLSQRIGSTPAVSTVRESKAVFHPNDTTRNPQPDFLNCAALFEHKCSPTELLEICLEIEEQLGRKRDSDRKDCWLPRTIDLDILVVGSEVISTEELIIPHPRLTERLFALEPLAELWPDWVHPIEGLTAADLLERLQSAQ